MLDTERFSNAEALFDHYAGVKARLASLRAPLALPAPPKAIAAARRVFPPMTKEQLLDAMKHRARGCGYHWIDVRPVETRMMRARRIIADHALAAGVTLDDVLGPSKFQLLVYVRGDAMLAVHEQLGFGHSELGRLFGRDHSTAYYALRKARERRAARDQALKEIGS